MNFRNAISLAVFAATVTTLVRAQETTPSTNNDDQIVAKKEALESFKAGDLPAGLEKLTAKIKLGPGALKKESQMGGSLAEISYWLANDGHGTAKDIAQLSIGEFEKGRGQWSQVEAASTLAAMGRLYEMVIGDPVKARALYVQAAAFNPNEHDALRGVARLDNVAALVAAKAQENEVMRLRNINAGRQ